MIQGRTNPGNSPVGTFIDTGTNYQTVCDSNVCYMLLSIYSQHIVYALLQTAATHIDSNFKSSVSLSWTAPPAGAGAIGFRYEFVCKIVCAIHKSCHVYSYTMYFHYMLTRSS